MTSHEFSPFTELSEADKALLARLPESAQTPFNLELMHAGYDDDPAMLTPGYVDPSTVVNPISFPGTDHAAHFHQAGGNIHYTKLQGYESPDTY